MVQKLGHIVECKNVSTMQGATLIIGTKTGTHC